MDSKNPIVFLKMGSQHPGGLEKYTHYLMHAFVERGYSVTLLTTGTPKCIEGVNSLSLAPHSKFTAYQLLRFNALCKRWLKTNPHNIVFGMERTTQQTHYRAGNGVHAAYLKQRRLVDPFLKRAITALNPLHPILLHLEREAFENRGLKKVFANSYMVRDEIVSHYKTPPQKIEVIHNGVEWHKMALPFEASISQKTNNPFHFLFVGNGYKRKGLSFLLNALGVMKNEEFQLTVIGKERAPLHFVHQAERLGLKNRVQFLGPQKEVLPFYQAADVLVIPTIYDPFANVTIEALAMGLFVVSSQFNGGKEILNPSSGLLIEELNSIQNFSNILKKTLNFQKTKESAYKIRQSVKELDFSNQLDKIVMKTVEF